MARTIDLWKKYASCLAGTALFLFSLPGALADADHAMGAQDRSQENAEGAGLLVSEIGSMELEGTNPTHLQVWVDVTNPGSEPAVNLTGEMRGAETAIVLGRWGSSHTGMVSRGGSTTETFDVMPRTSMTVGAFVTGNAPLASIGLTVASPDGHEYAGTSTGNGMTVEVPQPDVDAGVFGDWSAVVTHTGGLRGISYSFQVSFTYTDVYDNVSIAALPPGEAYHFYYNIWAEEPDTTIPPGMTITVNGTVIDGGKEVRVSYVAREGVPVEQVPVSQAEAAGGGDVGAIAVATVVGVAVVGAGVWALVRRGWRPTKLEALWKRKPGALQPDPSPEPPR